MMTLLKKFLKGLQYLITLPVLVVVLAIYAIFGVIMFIMIGTKALVLYFTGRNIFKDIPEDIEAKKILDAQLDKSNEVNNPDIPQIEEKHDLNTEVNQGWENYTISNLNPFEHRELDNKIEDTSNNNDNGGDDNA